MASLLSRLISCAAAAGLVGCASAALAQPPADIPTVTAPPSTSDWLLVYHGGYRRLPFSLVGPVWASYSTLYDARRFDVGGFPINYELFGNTQPGVQSLVGTVDCPASDIGTAGCIGVSGYAITSSTTNEAVGLFGAGMGGADNAQAWGFNGYVSNAPGVSSALTNTGHSGNYYGFEADVVSFKEGGVAPVANFRGYYCVGASEIQPTGTYDCMDIDNPGQGHGLAPWKNAIQIRDGAATVAAYVGATGTGNNVASMPFDFISRTSGGVANLSQIFADANADLIVQGAAGGAGILTANGGGTCSIVAAPTVDSAACPFSVTGSVSATTQLYPGTGSVSQSGGGLLAGTGNPGAGVGNNGDFYFRTDCTHGSSDCTWHKESGTWQDLN